MLFQFAGASAGAVMLPWLWGLCSEEETCEWDWVWRRCIDDEREEVLWPVAGAEILRLPGPGTGIVRGDTEDRRRAWRALFVRLAFTEGDEDMEAKSTIWGGGERGGVVIPPGGGDATCPTRPYS